MELEEPPAQNAGDNAAAPKRTTHSDPADPIFSMFMSRVQKLEDEKNVENWKGGAEGILVFTGLFSSTIATFIALSYPNLQQDPNVTAQLLLQQIFQQLSNTTTGDHGSLTGVSVPTSFTLPTSVVFINSVWFLSLVLSLTCALMATLLQQWAHRYLQIVQQRYAPLHYARVHEYFSQGAHRFGIFGFVEPLRLLLHISVSLFFTGLVVFAFRGNHVVAYFTLAIVGFFTLSYIALALLPLIFRDCPYQTPLTSVLWFSAQISIHCFFSVLYHCAKLSPKSWGGFRWSIAISFRQQRARSLSRTVISKLKSSSEYNMMDTFKSILTRTLHWLTEDQELEEFVAGIPGLYESEAFSRVGAYLDDSRRDDIQRTLDNIFPVLADLPGPMGFDAPLPWSIIRLTQRSIASNLSKPIQHNRTQACLWALYYIPGAIRDLLAMYAAGKHHCTEVLPLLNSPESLKIIDELIKKYYYSNDDVAISVRCAAAVVAAFIITPPLMFVSVTDGLKWDKGPGRQFLDERLRDDPDASPDAAPDDIPDSAADSAPPFDLNSDTTRLQNITRFLADIKDTLQDMNRRPWGPDRAESILRQELFKKRHTTQYVLGRYMLDQPGNRTSPAFVRAAQQDLITLTLEILARDPVAYAETPQREAFRDVRTWLEQEQEATLRVQPEKQGHDTVEVQPNFPFQLEPAEAKNSIKMVKLALGRVFEALPDTTPLAVHTSPP